MDATPVIGPASLLESWDRPSRWASPWRPRRLEALIGTPNADGTLALHHHFHAPAPPDTAWLRGELVSDRALRPGVLSQAGRAGTAAHDLVAHVPEAEGLVEYRFAVNAAEASRWRRVGVVTTGWSSLSRHASSSWSSLSRPLSSSWSSLSRPLSTDTPVPWEVRPAWDGPEDAAEWGTGRVVAVATTASHLHGWVQALVQVDGSLYHLHRQRTGNGRTVRWFRHCCLRLADTERFVDAAEPSTKLAQISGELDSQPGEGPRTTLSRSESTSGVRGTDLGVRFDHAGRTFLLFGDTHWAGRPRLGTRDAVAEVFDPDAPLPRVVFHGSPLRIDGGGTTMREYDVPLDAFSLAGDCYAFFTANHFRHEQVMGRSVLTRAAEAGLPVRAGARREPLRFRFLTEFSRDRFINVSAQRVGDHLLLWGSGAYRADDLRLARVDLTVPGVAEGLHRGDPAAFTAATRFWAGPWPHQLEPAVQEWSAEEAAARPLLTPGAHGEVSVRWVPSVDRFLMLSMAGPEDPAGAAVVLRSAPRPWGPWSRRLRLLDWIGHGMSFGDAARRFIRSATDGSDPVGDAIFPEQAAVTGAAYAPYLFDARTDGDELLLRYTLSTWNPYQVVLMQQRMTLSELIHEG